MKKSMLRCALAVAAALAVSSVFAEKKVLMIGNSFSQSVLTHLPAVAAAGGEELDISNLMIGGCVLERHVTNIVQFAQDPNFKPYGWPRYRNGKYAGQKKTNIPEALAAEKWDVVTIQQGSSKSFEAASYHPWGDELVKTIRQYAPQAKILVQQTWSYNECNRCIHDPYTGGPGWFKIDRDTMYRNLTRCYYDFAKGYGFDVIPTGNAVELYRHRAKPAPADDVVGRFPQPKEGWFDLIHLNDRGCWLQAYVWYKALFGKDPRQLPNAKDETDRLLREIANDVFSVPPLSIEPYPAHAGDFVWRNVYQGPAEGLKTITDMPGTFRLTAKVSVPSGKVEFSCRQVRFSLAADGSATAVWNPPSGTQDPVTWPKAAANPKDAELKVVRTNGGTSLWHFYVDGKELGRADTPPATADETGSFPRPSLAAEGGASVGRVEAARCLEDIPGYEKVASAQVTCDAPDGWKLNLRKLPDLEPGVEVWELAAHSATNAALPKFEVAFIHPADEVRHIWHAGNPFWSGYTADWRFTPDWHGSYKSGFAFNPGVLAALDANETSRCTVISSEARETIQTTFGYNEKSQALAATFKFGTESTDLAQEYKVRFRVDSRKVPYWTAVTEAMRWQRLAAGLNVTPAPEVAYDPVYSTWYAYGQSVDAGAVLREAKASAKMGLKNMFVDDGWNCDARDSKGPGYTICGDWEVSQKKFPRMREHVAQVHAAGMQYVMWYALPQVGVKSKAYATFKGKYLIESPTHAILDPRYPEVRKFMTDFCVKAMDDWDVDGFKLDFIDTIRIWDCNGDLAAKNGFKGCDTRSLMKGIELFLKDIQTLCRMRKRDTLIEFRQPYEGQAIRQYCNMMRVCDCPGDSVANRVGIAKLRLVCADTAVHSDMLTWPKDVSVEDAALQVLNSIFGVVQYSTNSRRLSANEQKMLGHWIGFTQEHRDALLRGAFRPHHPEQNYPVLEGENGLERIVGVYAPNVPAPCVADRDVYLVNASGADAILIDADAATTADLYDVCGAKAGTAKIAKGLQRLAVPRSGYAKVAPVAKEILIAAPGAKLTLSGTTGAILSLKDAEGVELLERADEFFTLQLLDAKGNARLLRSSDFQLTQQGQTLVFTRPEGPRVAMKIETKSGRFDFTPTVSCIPAGEILEWFDGPQPYVSSTGGRLYWPFYDGCEVSNLKQREGPGWIDYRPLGYTPRCKAWGALYPGNCQMQFMAFYKSDRRGLYFGCHDPTHTQMGVEYDWRSERATRLSLQMFCGEAKEGVWTAPAPFTLRLFTGGWMEACEIYRDFIHTLPEFQTMVKRPKWMYDSPVNLIYPVQGEGIDHGPNPMKTNRYYPFVNVMSEVEKYGKLFDSKIMALIMHWEGTAPWCPPYVWPPLGGEEALAKLRDALHARGDLLGLYCSGCAWTQVSCINGYSQEKKCRDEGLERWMMRGPKGEIEATICNHRFAQRFGYDLCLTEKWSQETLVEEIGKIAKFGVDYCQYFDQNIGGAALLCYSREHHHPPVPGAWQTKAMLDLQDQVFRKIEACGSKMTLGCEACAATPFVKNLFYNDSRANNDVSYGNPVAGLPFVFHEWMSNFSGNQIGHTADVGYRWMRSLHYGESFSVILGADGKLQNAWGIPWSEPRPDQERLIALVKNLNAVRKANLPWLLEGKMLKPFAEVATKRVFVKYGQLDVETDEVMSSFWEAPDGRRRAFLSNWGLKPASATVTFADGTKKVYALKPGEVVWFDDLPATRQAAASPGDAAACRVNGEKVHLIFDTDMHGDYDDVGALAILNALADEGACDILACVSSVRGGPSLGLVEAINRWYGRTDIPMGVAKEIGVTATGKPSGMAKVFADVAEEFGPGRKYPDSNAAPDAVEVYRKVLAAAPDKSVTVCTVGFLTNPRRLLESKPDAISPLSGRELVEKKVKAWYAMACKTPSGKECNSMHDAPSSDVCFRTWPTPIYFLDFDMGLNAFTGLAVAAVPDRTNPIAETFRRAFQVWGEGKTGRHSWDEMTVYAAVRGWQADFGTRRGTFTIDPKTGVDTWTDDPKGNHYLLTVKTPRAEICRKIDELMLRPF